MTYGDPELLWLVIIICAPLILFLIWTWRTKQRLITSFVQASRLMTLTIGVSKNRQKFKLGLLVVSVAFLCFALARPQWGETQQEVKESVVDVLLAVDTSKSMLATDATPNRLVRAKLAALDLLRIGSPNRFGLIPFAGAAFLQSPLSLDEDALVQSLQSIDVGSVPQGGTVFANAIDTAMDAFEKEENNQKILVIFTDGEDQEDGALEAATKAKKAGIKIFTVGIGTPEGELIRLNDGQNRQGYLRDEAGNVVKSRLNEALLKQIAESTGGFYVPLAASGSMNALYQYLKQYAPSGSTATRVISTRSEQFFWFVAVAIVLLLVEIFMPQQKREPAASNRAIRTLLVLLGIFALSSSTFASTTKAFESLNKGEYGKAVDEFERLGRKSTNDLRYPYDAGVAAYKLKEFNRAESYFTRSSTSPDIQLQQKSYYNLGNTHFQGGLEAEGKDRIAKWEQAVKDYEIALKIDSKDKDAASNAEFVRKQLEELKKQEEQKQKQEDEKNKDDKEKKDQDQKGDQKNKDEKQNNKDQKDPSKKDPNNKSNEKEEQKKNQQSGQKPGDQKDQQNQQSQNAKSADEQKKREDQERAEQLARSPQKMTPQQAMQLLDSLKSSEKQFPFTPMIQGRTTTKDW
ncbi:MAG: von Willebrand factor type [Verrucomicrobiales bacterium]|nr:von Willebrand factor type [Verrucomicrobiales bacterium]